MISRLQRVHNAPKIRKICLSASQNSTAKDTGRLWRDASSLIIAAPDDISGRLSNYSVLHLKRAAKSSFFPNAYVYPGGALDKADRNPKWLDAFAKFDTNLSETIVQKLFSKTLDRHQSELFPSDEASLSKGIVPNEVAFRICAIRETFEECGVLLLTNNFASRQNKGIDRPHIYGKSISYLISNDEVNSWRNKVHSDASEFFNLCARLQMVPDIWSLKEWSEWLTPIGYQKEKRPKRFDTVFYCCCLSEMPSSTAFDNMETTESQWTSPAEIIQRYAQEKVFLAPPQIVENLRLLNFSTIEELSRYLVERSSKGLERWTPYIVKTVDSIVVQLLPGDAAYPEDFDPTAEIQTVPTINMTYKEMEDLSAKFRISWRRTPVETVSSLRCTAKLKFGQVAPVSAKSVLNTTPKL